MNLGSRLREEQLRQGITSIELANRMSKPPQQISRWRRQRDMRVSTAMALCEALGISFSDFINEKSPQ